MIKEDFAVSIKGKNLEEGTLMAVSSSDYVYEKTDILRTVDALLTSMVNNFDVSLSELLWTIFREWLRTEPEKMMAELQLLLNRDDTCSGSCLLESYDFE